MIVAHAVHWLVALPAALVVAGLAVATLVEARRSRRRGAAVLREDEPAGQPASAAREDEGSATRPPGPSYSDHGNSS